MNAHYSTILQRDLNKFMKNNHQTRSLFNKITTANNLQQLLDKIQSNVSIHKWNELNIARAEFPMRRHKHVK